MKIKWTTITKNRRADGQLFETCIESKVTSIEMDRMAYSFIVAIWYLINPI
jgi:hypothetical protein